jgi:alpha-glucosidase
VLFFVFYCTLNIKDKPEPAASKADPAEQTHQVKAQMTSPRLLSSFAAAVAYVLLSAASAQAAPVTVSSPDRSVAIRIEQDASRFTISRRGKTVIAPSPLGLELDGAPEFGALALEWRDDVRVDRTIPLIATKAAAARDHYRGATLVFRERAPGGRRLFIDVRAYDDGVAFRYRIDSPDPVRLRGERTAFVPAGDPDCLVSVAQGAHEVPFERMKVSQLRDGLAYDVPVVCTTPSGETSYAITQANLNGYTGASLWREGSALRVRLSAVPNRAGPAFVSRAGLSTAWRAVMLGDRVGDLIGSHLIGNLNPAPEGDFSWVRPGKAAWDWWSGPLAGMKPDMASYRRFIDFSAAAGLPYYLIDAGWALGSGPDAWIALPKTDITRAADGIDIPALVRYAASKGVDLLLWAHWEHVAARMDEVLDTYARWGIKGIKVDFMNRDDQEMVEFYQRIARATAKRHLLLDLHSAYVPDGLERTYPNFITQEGVMGAEWNKMNKKITPRHNLMLPYTRMLAGPMDYTPGGFRNGTPASFVVRAEMPLTQSTRGQALAMYVVYDSPLQMVSDAPEAYRDAAGFDFIERVPTAWDETRFLSGEPGRDIVLARRKGSTWYLGAMTADDAKDGRTERVALRFLPAGHYRATVWEDGDTPNEVKRTEREVTASDVLSLRLASAGGAAVILERVQ